MFELPLNQKTTVFFFKIFVLNANIFREIRFVPILTVFTSIKLKHFDF